MSKKEPDSIIARLSQKPSPEKLVVEFNSPRRLYRHMLKEGIRTVPVHYSDKKPIGDDWTTRPLAEDDFASKKMNVGLQLGKASGGLVDIDLDCEEAKMLARHFLPDTGWKRGRGSAVSGYLYKVEGPMPKYVKNCDPTAGDNERAAIVELRDDNKMSVVYGLHPDGDQYELRITGELARVSGEDLTRAVNDLSAAVLLIRSYQNGSRQDFVLGLAGALAYAGRSLEDAERFVTAIGEYTEDEELCSMRLPAVEATYEKFENGEPVTGWATMQKNGLLSPKAVKCLKKWTSLGDQGKSPAASTAVRALNLLSNAQLCSTPRGEAFATFISGDHRETWHVRSKNFGNHVRSLYLRTYGEVLDTKNLNDIIPLFEHRAAGNVREVYTRVASFEEATYIDLANDKWEAVRVTPEEWDVVSDCPVQFRRANGMLILPTPESGGSIDELRQFLNVESDKDWLMMLAWAINALCPRGPYPILALYGEQGTAKSTVARVLRSLIDPNAAPLRSAPVNERDLMIAATNSWCPTFDNLSVINAWFSDALCRISTGGGYATRELHTNAGEAIFDVTRPVVLNSITDVAWSGDLIDRMVIAHLPTIPDEKRLRPADFWERFEKARGRLFGALLDLTCAAMWCLPEVKLDRVPRMADFAYLGAAVEAALGMEHGLFMRTYEEYRTRAIEQTLESSPLARAVMAFMRDKAEWSGKPGELLRAVEPHREGFGMGLPPKDWPTNARKLTSQLRRIAPDLRRCAGIDARQSEEKYGNSYTWALTNAEAKAAEEAKVARVAGKKARKGKGRILTFKESIQKAKKGA